MSLLEEWMPTDWRKGATKNATTDRHHYIPRYTQAEGVLELLQDLRGEQCHVPGPVQFDRGAHGKDALQRVILTMDLGHLLVDALHVGGQRLAIEAAL